MIAIFTLNLISIATGEQPRLAQLMMMKTATGEILNVIEAVTPVWKNFGYLLDFDHNGQKLDVIEASHIVKGPVVCCQEMFKFWLDGNGKPATWGTLIELLGYCGKGQLAEQLKSALD